MGGQIDMSLAITEKQIVEAYKSLDILTAQIGNARIRKMHKDPLKQFIKAVENEITTGRTD